MDFCTPILSNDNLTNAIIRLPGLLRRYFFQGYKKLSSNIFDDSANLMTLENWLEKKLEPLFNPLADIILNKEDQFWRRIKGASRCYSDTTQSNIKISSQAC